MVVVQLLLISVVSVETEKLITIGLAGIGMSKFIDIYFGSTKLQSRSALLNLFQKQAPHVIVSSQIFILP